MAYAESYTGFCDRDCARANAIVLFGGGSVGGALYDFESGASASRFWDWGWKLEAGVEIPVSESWSLRASGQLGQGFLQNTANGPATVETGTRWSYGLQAEILYGWLGLGGGIRRHGMEIFHVDQVQSGSVAYFSGLVPFVSLSMGWPLSPHLGFCARGQYDLGQVSGTDYRAISGSLGLMFLLPPR
jgi:hypothetical protein